jgi:hypothetical protein
VAASDRGAPAFSLGLNLRLTISTLHTILCLMKVAVYLTDPAEMRKARLNQPRVNSEQLRAQREAFRRASERFSEAARKETSIRR